jgi:hypothetical protein
LPIVSKIQHDLAMFLREQRPLAAKVCLETLHAIATDSQVMATARVAAATRLGEFAGVLGVRGAAGATKDPQDMTTSELHSQVAALEQALSERAKVVSHDLPNTIDVGQWPHDIKDLA